MDPHSWDETPLPSNDRSRASDAMSTGPEISLTKPLTVLKVLLSESPFQERSPQIVQWMAGVVGDLARMKTAGFLSGESSHAVQGWSDSLRTILEPLDPDSRSLVAHAIAKVIDAESPGTGSDLVTNLGKATSGEIVGPAVGREEVILGRIVEVRRLGKSLTFLTVHSSGRFVDCVCEHPPLEFKKSAFVELSGAWRQKRNRPESEFAISKIIQHIKPATTGGNNPTFSEMLSPQKVEGRQARMITEQTARRYFESQGFDQVVSPIIVGDWVKGQTGAFKLDFYQSEAYLSISPMIHHQIVQLLGHPKVFEIARLFRRENDTSIKKLCEFHNIAMGMVGGTVDDLIHHFSALITQVTDNLRRERFKNIPIPETVEFERVTFSDLLARANLTRIPGHQLPAAVRSYLEENFPSFVWVTHFPEDTRPFYVKSEDGHCFDCQLWYRGRKYLAAGGEIEPSLETTIKKIEREGKNPASFAFHLEAMSMGVPPIANIDMGLERLLGNWLEGTVTGDFAFFPRYKGRIAP
jgi:aspartyl/asparaginyl-tRNA synthetase